MIVSRGRSSLVITVCRFSSFTSFALGQSATIKTMTDGRRLGKPLLFSLWMRLAQTAHRIPFERCFFCFLFSSENAFNWISLGKPIDVARTEPMPIHWPISWLFDGNHHIDHRILVDGHCVRLTWSHNGLCWIESRRMHNSHGLHCDKQMRWNW